MTDAQVPAPGPEAPPTSPVRIESRPDRSGFESYQRVAETVGMLPNLRLKDNAIQALVIACTTVIGLIVSWIITRNPLGFIFGALGGLVAGVLVSGFVLMILGFVRATRSR